MPIPTPKKDEEKEAFLSRCVSTLKKLDPDKSQDQVIAICYSQWENKKDLK